MSDTDLTIIGLLVVIAAQTTYTTYRTWRTTEKAQSSDVLVDTSVLMDGRIVPVAQSGFMPGRLVIPRSVIGELQLLADKGDTEKRERARRGLDVVRELQAIDNVTVEILQDGSNAREGVDERLLMHAKESGGILCTIDFNLNKVAIVEGIRVLNINELARGLRMAYLPGDKLSLELTTTGTDSHQAVGHLDDGTMVVVEQAKKMIGKSVDIVVIRSLQTAAGKMMFARLAQANSTSKSSQNVKNESTTKKPVPRSSSHNSRSSKPQHKQSSSSVKKSMPKNTQRKSSPATANKQPSKKPRTSAQREASFISLVNRQD